MFSLSFYVKTDELSGYFNYGYRTLRGHKAFTDLHAMQRGNLMTLENSDFNLFFFDNVFSKRNFA